MAILLPQRVAVTLTHCDVFQTPFRHRHPPPGATIAPPAAEVKRAGRARSESEWLSAPADVLQLVMRESMILVLAGGRLAPHVTALSEQPKRGALHHHHERAPHERGSRDVY